MLVYFSPTSAGSKSAILELSSNDPDTPTLNVPLSGGGVAIPGDLDGDGQVCRTNLNIILSYRNQPADVCPECDLDGDGMITALDARKLVLLCTRPRCACE
ncbi:unnamed protein product [marine sediment metagenome]|uniref:Dockerin domain-containing protein n=1 Tax=marine sediment metagenome TaxID=412755 RepID=X0WGD8_9ZZZZ